MSVDIAASTMSHLYADDTFRGFIGDNIYRDRAPEDTPLRDDETLYVVVHRLWATPGRHLTSTSGYAEAFVQINTWGSNRTTVEAVADAIREALDHFLGPTLGTPPNGATVKVVELIRDPDEWIAPQHGEHDGVYGARQTAAIEHTESVPTFA